MRENRRAKRDCSSLLVFSLFVTQVSHSYVRSPPIVLRGLGLTGSLRLKHCLQIGVFLSFSRFSHVAASGAPSFFFMAE